MLRFCYAVSDESIEEGLARIGRVLPELAERSAIARDARDARDAGD